MNKEVTKTQSIASSNAASGGFNFGTPKKDTKAEIPKPSLFGSSAPPSGDGGIFGKKPEVKPAASEVEKAPEKKSIFGKPSGGSTGGISGSSAPSGGGIFGSAPAKPTENPFASKAPSTPKANPFGSKSAGVNPFGSGASSGGGGGLFGSTSTKTPVKEYKFNEEKESEDENDETEDEVSGDEEEDSAEDQSADETLIPNRQSEEPPVETKVGFKLYSRKMILSYLAKIHM